ncbi:MAG: hypothetical protein IPO85_08400 [Saprospiraceae bacterium]|uniref:Uncharacterized protein n=1 Tax=Candidatus Defluviibacterium haderslevense TaxID=2981993 RepID=A0A9D7S9B6_9BACT|nr:hypothetical protein [Candidatus Defluviibacterium haderslevense]
MKIKNWYYGNNSGCTYKTNYFEKLPSILPNYLFVFNKPKSNLIELKGITSPLKFRRAFIEFCVQIKPGLSPQDCNLQPTNCSTYFDETQYKIDRFIDKGANNKLWPDSTIHRKPVLNCCQYCEINSSKD